LGVAFVIAYALATLQVVASPAGSRSISARNPADFAGRSRRFAGGPARSRRV